MINLQVAAAIIRKEDKVLICQRAKDDEAALLWEFPGGKLKKGEKSILLCNFNKGNHRHHIFNDIAVRKHDAF